MSLSLSQTEREKNGVALEMSASYDRQSPWTKPHNGKRVLFANPPDLAETKLRHKYKWRMASVQIDRLISPTVTSSRDEAPYPQNGQKRTPYVIGRVIAMVVPGGGTVCVILVTEGVCVTGRLLSCEKTR